MLVEVDQRALLLLLGRWGRHATGHGNGLWVESRPSGVGVNHGIPLGCIHVGLPAARHSCDGKREVKKEVLLHTTVCTEGERYLLAYSNGMQMLVDG